jgi:ABC-type nitrate/sulfonate/bicarbonate transport system substrate-binding protein
LTYLKIINIIHIKPIIIIGFICRKKRRIVMKKITIFVVLLGFGVFSIVGCSKKQAGETARAGLRKATMMLDWVPNTSHTGLYVAKALGYYEEAGLDVDIIQLPSGAADQLVAAGQGDFGTGTVEETIYARSQDEPLPIIGIAAIIQHNTSGFLSLKEEGIKSPRDWGGKTYGGWGSASEEVIIKYIAEKNGVDFSTIRFINIGFDDVQTALRGEIDFVWVWESIEVINFEKQGLEYDYLPHKDMGEAFDFYTPILIANENTVRNDPDFVRAFVTATAKGYDYAIDNPEAAAKILLEAAPELDDYIVTEGQKYLATRFAQDAPQWGWMEEEVWERYAKLVYDNGLIKRLPDVKKAFTTEFLPTK